ncbi:hypothetical protein C8Q72DRAFT_879825 [Fomitopsis betulina]|nr:hypothetical protein C8Q72DRAFT_879825 [Fomitopsis betulina]
MSLVLCRYNFLGYTEDHIEEGALVLFREDDAWTASRFRQEIGCPDALYQEGGCGEVARSLGLSFAFTADAFNVPDDRIACLEGVDEASAGYADGC